MVLDAVEARGGLYQFEMMASHLFEMMASRIRCASAWKAYVPRLFGHCRTLAEQLKARVRMLTCQNAYSPRLAGGRKYRRSSDRICMTSIRHGEAALFQSVAVALWKTRQQPPWVGIPANEDQTPRFKLGNPLSKPRRETPIPRTLDSAQRHFFFF